MHPKLTIKKFGKKVRVILEYSNKLYVNELYKNLCSKGLKLSMAQFYAFDGSYHRKFSAKVNDASSAHAAC